MIRITDDNRENCCGCSACMNICPVNAIQMKPDIQGFLYPAVNSETCINCGKCESVCPVINNPEEHEFEQEAYLIQNKDKEILKDSTSGGAFTAIAQAVLKRGGVVFGAGYGENFYVRHEYAERENELHRFRNSKYVQSDKLRTYSEVKEFLNQNRYVLFSGTPCDIEGLLNFLGDMSSSDFLLTSDVTCHAAPSPAVFQAYLNLQRQKNEDNIRDLRFRDKSKYGYMYSQFAVIREDSRSYEGIETNIFLRAFFSNVCDRPSCYECRFKKRYRRSDFTLWDCWNAAELSRNVMFNQNAGVTRMLVHSEKGKNFLNDILSSCIYEKISADDAVRSGSREMTHSVPKDEERYKKFWSAFYENPEEALIKFFPMTFSVRLEASLRRFAFRTGIYSFVKKMYKKFFGERRR